jgi:DNA-binding transcriptional ArsR family regulator
MPEQDVLVMPEQAPMRVALEPAQSAFHSLMMLKKADHLSGLGDWVAQTLHALTPEEAKRHTLVFEGFGLALFPERSWPSFPLYVDHLASLNPEELRDRLLTAYARLPLLSDGGHGALLAEPVPLDLEVILGDAGSYLDFLRERFDEAHIDVELETEAYAYVVDPPAMQELIVSHLRLMWDKYLAAEWQRVEPMLRDAVRACQQVDLGNLSRLEAIQRITDQNLDEEKWKCSLAGVDQVIFVPTVHIGPYAGRLWSGKTMWVLFGARLPEGVQLDAPALSRAEIVMRLSALAEDSRLRILKLISEEEELHSKEIMGRLELSQSATSRHLKQLSATGYLTERRCNGAKCYRLNPERIERTLMAVKSFLLDD